MKNNIIMKFFMFSLYSLIALLSIVGAFTLYKGFAGKCNDVSIGLNAWTNICGESLFIYGIGEIIVALYLTKLILDNTQKKIVKIVIRIFSFGYELSIVN